MSEDKITTAPYDWQAGTNNSGIERFEPATPLDGGISDERFQPTTIDAIRQKIDAVVMVAKATPHLVSLVYGYLTMNWKIIIGSLSSLIVAFLVAKWPALQTIAVGDYTLSQIVSTGLTILAGIILPNQIAQWKKEHPNENLEGAK